jgi:23S rRNA pseudouridine2605 synthase
MFAVLGYKIKKLDRVSFAGITKKNLARGEYRALSEAEIVQLKMLG